MSKNTILITAFEPFGEDTINPTQMVLEKLPSEIDGFHIEKLLLPVEFIKSQEILLDKYEEIKPFAVIMLGQAGGRAAIMPETTAKNVMNARIPDNIGYSPINIPIVEGGPDSINSTLPIETILDSLKALDILCEKSNDAGEYVCNTAFYSMLYHNKGSVPTGFVHVPFIKEQNHIDKPYMELDAIYQGILTLVKVVIGGL